MVRSLKAKLIVIALAALLLLYSLIRLDAWYASRQAAADLDAATAPPPKPPAETQP
jgi:hypothetical protein